MNLEWMRDNLREAIESLQGTLDDLLEEDFEDQEEALESLRIDFAHAYYHINCAYNGACGADPYMTLEHGGSPDLQFFPTDLPDIYGSWVRPGS